MATLKKGRKAPAFSSVDQDGKPVSLSDYLGKKLALYFYPADDTPTCTKQACNLRDNYSALKKVGIEILGVSTDGVKSHQKFVKKYQLPFRLVVDEDLKIVNKYGIWREKTFMGRTYIGLHRTTFLIDETGKIAHIIEKPVSKMHAEEILEAWETA